MCLRLIEGLRRIRVNKPRLPGCGSDLGEFAGKPRGGGTRGGPEGVLERGDLPRLQRNGALRIPTNPFPKGLLTHLDAISFAGDLDQNDQDSLVGSGGRKGGEGCFSPVGHRLAERWDFNGGNLTEIQSHLGFILQVQVRMSIISGNFLGSHGIGQNPGENILPLR